MTFLDAVHLALAQIRAQRLKSWFTLLGVGIGVTFLIAVVSVVNGMNRYVERDFAGKLLGVNTFNLRRFPDVQTGEVTDATRREWERRPEITEEDAEAVRAALPPGTRWAIQDVRWVAPQSAFRSGGPQALVEAVTLEYFAIKDLAVEQGRPFTAQEDALGSPVVVIGREVAETFFPNVDPLGREIRLGGRPFRVVGVLERQGAVFGLSLDRRIVGPFHSPLRRVTKRRGGLYGVLVQAPTEAALLVAQERVREAMRRRRHLRPAEPDDFVLETSRSALAGWVRLKAFLLWGGLLLPAIGLVVGAIVIMNIMLVAVAERTREIGIRKSLGARRRDILAQFLVEGAMLSLVGAAAGIALGIGLSALVAALSPLPARVAPWSIAAAVAVGAGVGIVAGAYPASRAARLDPVVALRAD